MFGHRTNEEEKKILAMTHIMDKCIADGTYINNLANSKLGTS